MSILVAYQIMIEEKLAQWLAMPERTAGALETMAVWLGCAHISLSRGYCINAPEQPESECEPVVIGALVLMLRKRDPLDRIFYEIDQVVLDGLLRNDRWKKCAEDASFLYEFAALITRFCDFTAPQKYEAAEHVRRNRLRAEVTRALTSWLEPQENAPKLGSEAVAELLFGSPWVSIMRSVGNTGQIGDLLLATRPPFRRSLTGLQAESLDLPDLECS